MKNTIGRILCSVGLLIMVNNNYAQEGKVINEQSQSWLSINSTVRVAGKWGFVADLHERRNNFLSDVSFHFVRVGITHWINDNLSVTAGYGHMWVAPTAAGFKTYANENRIYQQGQLITKLGRVSLMQRIRNEQRWQQKIVNDKATGDNKFTDRVRYLLSFTIPVFKNRWYPSLALADELSVQFGKEVVYNTFDQNRTFIGIKESLSKSVSFDLGYMLVFQQKASGTVYDKNHTFRWFFYYTPDLRKKTHSHG
jgi:uncharacterized protein DUF2490